MFSPADSRFKAGGPETELVLKIKRQLIKTFNEIGFLCTNFRLGQLLHLYKQKAVKWTIEECDNDLTDLSSKLNFDPFTQNTVHYHKSNANGGSPKECSEAQYIMQSTKASVEEMYDDFETMFPGGSGDGANVREGRSISSCFSVSIGLFELTLFFLFCDTMSPYITPTY